MSTAKLKPPPGRLQAFYQAAKNQPDVVRHIFGVLGGTIPIKDLNPDTAFGQ